MVYSSALTRNLQKNTMRLLFLILTGSATLYLLSCAPRSVETITIKGSDTEVSLVLELAEAYMALDSGVSISVSGGGTGVGVAALLNGRTDLANASRTLSPSELSWATDHGMALEPVVFATDALALIVNPAVGLDKISLQDLGSVFAGEVTNWKGIGGGDLPVSLYGRQSSSGTFLYFREKVLGREFSPNLKQLNGTAQIVEAIRQDPGGIGYVGIGYLNGQTAPEGLRVLALQAHPDEKAISPLDHEAVLSGKYPLTRPLFQFSNGAPKGRIANFIQFELGPAGQAIVARNGYLPATQAGSVLTQTQKSD